PEDHVADQGLVQIGVAPPQFVDQADDQVQRLDLVERAVPLLTARRANGLVNERFFGHEDIPVQVGLREPCPHGPGPLPGSLTASPNSLVGRMRAASRLAVQRVPGWPPRRWRAGPEAELSSAAM